MRGTKYLAVAGVVSLFVSTGLILSVLFGPLAPGPNKATTQPSQDSSRASAVSYGNAIDVAHPETATDSNLTPGGSTAEDIKIRGRWVLEVRDPDGTLADRREFDNEVVAGGRIVARILSRQSTVGEWRVYVLGERGRHPCRRLGGCQILESGVLSTSVFPNLTVTASRARVRLDGHATVQQDSSILEVSTDMRECDPEIRDRCRDTSSGTPFSEHFFSDPGCIRGSDHPDKHNLRLSPLIRATGS